MNDGRPSRKPQMEFSKPRMAVLRVFYYLVSTGLLYLAKARYGFPDRVFLAGALVLLAIIIASYPLQLRLIQSVAYREKQVGPHTMIGLRGWAMEDLSPLGKVKVRGEIWRASSRSGTIMRGEAVMVVALDGLTVIVDRPGMQGAR